METDQYVIDLKADSCVNFNLQNLHFRTPETSSLGATAFNRAQLNLVNGGYSARNCKFGNDPTVNYNAFSKVFVGRGAIASFNNCYFRLKARDTGSINKLDRSLYAAAGSTVYMGGGNTLVGTRILVATQGTPDLRLNGEVVFRDVYDSDWDNTGPYGCIDHRGPSRIFSNAKGVLRFFEFTGSTTCDEAVRSNMINDWLQGGTMTLPEMYGSVNSEYGVITRRACNVQVHPSSSLSSSLGINKFSADGGLTLCAQANDLTMITGTLGKPVGSFPFLEATGFVQYNTGSVILGNGQSSNITISGSMSWKARESFTANGTASAYIEIIGADSTAGSFGIAIPSATGSEGQILLVKDEGGNCSAENVTITTFAAETIDGGATVLLDNDYESVNLYSNGANWFIW